MGISYPGTEFDQFCKCSLIIKCFRTIEQRISNENFNAAQSKLYIYGGVKLKPGAKF
jgi:hypothetical protein